MEYRLPLFEGHAFLGGRGVAFRARTRAEQVLQSDPNSLVFLDCKGVDGVSHSFADELLSSLSDLLGAAVEERVSLINCISSVYDDFVSVAEMHQLHMPGRGPACEVRHYA